MSTPAEYDAMTKEEQVAFDKQAREKEQAEQAGKLLNPFVIAELTVALPYSWTQDLETVSVSVPLPAGTRGKDCIVDIQRRKLKVQVKGSEPILEGELFNDISKDDSSWTIGKCLATDICSWSNLIIDSGIMNIEMEKVS